ncbi:MAG: hypothetical protein WA441_09395 [Methyloceanibacter sp.]|jgi:hypothetical protein
MDQRSSMGMGEEDETGALPALSFSLLRISVPARFAIVAVTGLLLWAVVLWALA